jgi:hypothetical protein
MNTQSGSQDLVNFGISTYTGSQNVINASVDAHILKQATQTGSQDLVNYNISIVTSSIDAHILGISIYTASANTTNTSIDAHILKQATQTGSQDLVNLGISSVTGSLIGITNGLMAFTAALDNTYATDAQLLPLIQATASIQFATASLNIQTGSQDLVNLNISTYTGSQNVINSSVDAHILKQATQTGSQDLVNLGISSVTGSLIGITNGLMAFTAALDSTYATDAQLYQLYQATASIQFATASLNTQTGSQNTINFNISVVTSSIDSHILKQATQTGSQDLVNLGISTFTGSLRNEVNGIEAYTASLKNAFTIDGNNDVYFTGKITTQEVHTTYTTSSVLFQSGSTKFGNSSDDIHEFTGSKFEVFNSDSSGTMYAVVKNNRARNAAVKTTTTNGSFIAGTSIGTDAFQYQIYDEVEGVNRVTINSQGGTTLQGAVTASQTLATNNYISVSNTGTNASLRINNTTATTGRDWWLLSLNNGGFGLYDNTNSLYNLQITPDGYFGIGKNSTSVSNGDLIGLLAFNSNDVSTNSAGAIASIRSYATADYNTGNVEGDMRFYVSNGSAPNGSLLSGNESARINKLGYFKASNDGTYYGATSAYHELRNTGTDYNTFITSTHASNPNGIYLAYTVASPNGTGNLFLVCKDGTTNTRAEIRSNGGIANYQSNDVDLSDERVKTDITPLSSSWNEVKEYEIVSYKYIDQTHDDLNIGVIAQQIELVNPNLIDSGNWESGSGEPLKTVYNKDLYFTAIKALQEAMIRIEQLETKVAQLENN